MLENGGNSLQIRNAVRGATRPDWPPLRADLILLSVDPQSEVAVFLRSRRARMSPERVDLPSDSSRRRVPGLRRAEVALLAGISVDYYIRLEQGQVGGISEGVLAALARALELDDAERAYLLDLVEATKTGAGPRRPRSASRVRPILQHVLDMTAVPALLNNELRDILAGNRLGQVLFPFAFTDSARPVNHARFLFLDPSAPDFYVNWEVLAEHAVALLRAEVGRSPNDPVLSALIGELSAGSPSFTTWWDAHEVRLYGQSPPVRVSHPEIGELTLTYESLEVVADRSLTVSLYIPEPGSHAEQSLMALGRAAR